MKKATTTLTRLALGFVVTLTLLNLNVFADSFGVGRSGAFHGQGNQDPGSSNSSTGGSGSPFNSGDYHPGDQGYYFFSPTPGSGNSTNGGSSNGGTFGGGFFGGGFSGGGSYGGGSYGGGSYGNGPFGNGPGGGSNNGPSGNGPSGGGPFGGPGNGYGSGPGNSGYDGPPPGGNPFGNFSLPNGPSTAPPVPTPEPASFFLVGAGLAGFALVRRTTRRA